MKSTFNKLMIGAALLATTALTACVDNLDQLPKDPNTFMANSFAQNPKKYIGDLAGKCYMGLAVSGQKGPDGAPDIEGIDGGTFQWSRSQFMVNQYTTDECWWIYYNENNVDDLQYGTWGVDNSTLYGAYSRFYCHIAVCNDFLRTIRNLSDFGVKVGGSGEGAISQAEVDQLCREVRALRALTYYNVIDFWGRATFAWDDQKYGDTPPQAPSRKWLYETLVADLENVESTWPDGQQVVYGRIGKEAVQALLCRYYLNQGVFTNGELSAEGGYQKCWAMAQKIIANHESKTQLGGLAADYLSVFCGNNDMFMPGGSLPSQNEILWGIPYDDTYTQAYGGTTFLVNAPIINNPEGSLDPDQSGDGFCAPDWVASGKGWGCLGCRPELINKFDFNKGVCSDLRTYLWMTSTSGYASDLTANSSFFGLWHPIKFTNVYCNSDGTMPRWTDAKTKLNRCGISTLNDKGETVLTAPSTVFGRADLPIIRLADVYLMAAECAARGQGDKAKALTYVNYIRKRANAVLLQSESELTEGFILDERSRELYWEGTRRTDLVRFNQFTSGYNWTWKGGVYAGTQLEPTRNVFPIPQNIKAVYGSKLEQNAGY